tara:strand:+ start:96 stop:1106 length:1011 start_codon:yes stop_codon:yes gene_type:complete
MGYTANAKRDFLILHALAFFIHLASSYNAFNLAPPAEKMKQFIYVEEATFGKTATGEPTIDIVKKEVYKNANAISIIAWNEALATFSHFIAFSIVLIYESGGYEEENKNKYNGRSRPEEYWRRWIEYAITAGILEVGMLVGQGECNLIILSMVLFANLGMQIIGFYNDYTEKEKWNIIPSITAFFIMFSIIVIFIIKALNQSSDGHLESLNYGYLTVVFSIFYLSFGIHQMFYLNWKDYAEKIDIDKIFIVLGFTSKIVLSWTYIAIARSTWDEIDDKNEHRIDEKVNWEGGNDSITGWNWVKYSTVIASVIIIAAAYIIELTCMNYGKGRGKRFE